MGRKALREAINNVRENILLLLMLLCYCPIISIVCGLYPLERAIYR